MKTSQITTTIAYSILCSFFCTAAFGGNSTTPTGDMINWPDQVNAAQGQMFTIPIQITPGPLGGTNVAQVSATGAGVNFNQFVSLPNGTTTVNVPGTNTGTTPTQLVMFSVVTGIQGGSDNPAVAFNVTLTTAATVPPTDDKTSAGKTNDPVSTATGELYDGYPADLSLGGPLTLEFRRYYASLLTANGPATRLGNNWSHNFEWLMTVNGSQAQVFRFGGRGIQFALTGGAWHLVNPEQYGYQLVSGAGGTYQFLDPRNNLIYTFAGSGTTLGLSAIQDRNGNTLTVTPPVNGSAQVSDGLGRTLSFTYDPTKGNLLKVADQTGRTVSFTYDTANNLSQVTDANGKAWSFSYTAAGGFSGLITKTTLPLGNSPISQTWDTSGRVATQVDSRGNTTTFVYNQNSSANTDPLGATFTETSRNSSDLLTFADPDNQSVSIAYDGNGRRTSITDRLGGKTTLTYHQPSGYIASETNASGSTTTYTYTAQTASGFTFYKCSQVQYPDGTTTLFTYDANGNATAITDQAGKVWKFAYNSRGQFASITDPAGRVSAYSYNSDGTVATQTDAAGNVTTYSYDAAKRVSQMKFADGATRSFTYDALDNVISTVDELGNTLGFSYNANNRIQTAIDPLGKSLTLTYNNDEEVSKATDRTGQSTTFVYDKNELLNAATTPAGETFTFAHDNHHRLSSVLDPSGKGFSISYDKENLPISITDALSRKTSFTLDALGYPLQITTPLTENYSLKRDVFERITSSTDPTGQAMLMTYDPRGSLATLSIAGLAASYARDAAGLMTAATDPNGHTWMLGRDSAGRVGSITDPLNRAIKYTYDQRHRFASQQTALGTVTFTYDASGNLLARGYSDSTSVQYKYDSNDRIVSATGVALSYDAESRITASNGLTVARDADGRISSITYAPGKTVNYTYNLVGLLASITDWNGGATTFLYDAAQELTTITRPNKLATHIAYDGDGRTASITEDAGSSVSVQRDKSGRVVSENRTQPATGVPSPGVSAFTFDAANQVSSYTYDSMGRVTSDGLHTYTWDLASRLAGYNGVNGAATATYDAFGLRTSLTSAAGTQSFVWNYATGLPSLATVQSAGADQSYYVYLPDGKLLYTIDATKGARHFYHFDEYGSTTLLTDDKGTVTDSYEVAPFGETVKTSGTTTNPFTWMGQLGVMQEGSIGLYYMRARYYDSTSARFLSPDPLFIPTPKDLNLYQFAENDPLDLADPFGTQTVSNVIQQVNTSVSSGLDTLKTYTPEGGSALDGPGSVSFATGFVSKAFTGYADDITKAANSNLAQALTQDGANVMLPGQTLSTSSGFGNSVEQFSNQSNLANNLKQAGDLADAAGKFVDVAKEAVKLNDSIKAAEKEQATNSAATDIAEASALQTIWNLRYSGKISSKKALAQARAYIASANESQEAGLTALVVDEWIAGAKFVQNSLTSLAASGVTKGKFAGKKLISGTSAVVGKYAGSFFSWAGSVWSGTNPNAK